MDELRNLAVANLPSTGGFLTVDDVTASDLPKVRTLEQVADAVAGALPPFDPSAMTDEARDALIARSPEWLAAHRATSADIAAGLELAAWPTTGGPAKGVRHTIRSVESFGETATAAQTRATLQAAIDASVSGQWVMTSPGVTYTVDASLVYKSGMRLIIDRSEITAAAGTKIFHDNGVAVTDAIVTGFKGVVSNASASSTGYGFFSDTAINTDVWISGIEFKNLFRGVNIYRFAGLHIDNCIGRDLLSSLWAAGLVTNRSEDFYANGNRAINCGKFVPGAENDIGFVAYCDTVRTRDNLSINGGRSENINQVHSLYFRSCTDVESRSDGGKGHLGGSFMHVSAEASDAACADVDIIDARADSCPDYYAIRVTKTNRIRIIGGRLSRAGINGMYISNANDVTIDGTTIVDANRKGSSGAALNAAIFLETVDDYKVRNVSMYARVKSGAIYGMGAGIRLSVCVNGSIEGVKFERSTDGGAAYQLFVLSGTNGRVKIRGTRCTGLSQLFAGDSGAAETSLFEDCVATTMSGAWVALAANWTTYDVMYNTVQQVAARA